MSRFFNNISLLFFFFCVIAFLIAAYLLATEESPHEFLKLNVNAQILEDGSLVVEEERTVSYNALNGGPFTRMHQVINKYPGTEIVEVAVEEEGVFYELGPRSADRPAGKYAVTEGLRWIGIEWYYEAMHEVRTFTLHYRVVNAVDVHSDVAELYYQFVGDEWTEATEEVFVSLTLPAGARVDDLKAFGHGPLYGEVFIESGQEIIWEVSPLPANTFLEGRVLFPPELVPAATNLTGRTALPEILAEQEKWAAEADRERLLSRTAWVLAVLIVIGSLFLIVFFYLRYGKEHQTSFHGDYYRELPGNHTPAEVGVLWHFGKVLPAAFTATIMDLARRGYLRLDEYEPPRQGLFRRGKKVDYAIVNMGKQEPVAPHEHELLSFLFIDVGYRKEAVTFMEIEEYAKKNKAGFALFWNSWKNNLGTQGTTFFDPETKKGKKIALWTGLAMVAAGLLLQFPFSDTIKALFIPVTLAMVAGGVVIMIISRLFRRRSPQGVEEFVRWRAFRRFLLHFSEMQRHEIPSLIIWEHYLVYAVTLGVAKQVLKQLELVYPGLQDGTHRLGYGWYNYGAAGMATSGSGFAGGFDSLVTSIESSMQQSLQTATSRSSSSSGGGGGFSGGGGGGKGGGGGGVD